MCGNQHLHKMLFGKQEATQPSQRKTCLVPQQITTITPTRTTNQAQLIPEPHKKLPRSGTTRNETQGPTGFQTATSWNTASGKSEPLAKSRATDFLHKTLSVLHPLSELLSWQQAPANTSNKSHPKPRAGRLVLWGHMPSSDQSIGAAGRVKAPQGGTSSQKTVVLL